MDNQSTSNSLNSDGLAKSAHKAVDVVAERMASAEQKIQDAKAATKDSIEAGKNRVLDKSSEIAEGVRNFARTPPVMALVVAFATGLLAFALMRK